MLLGQIQNEVVNQVEMNYTKQLHQSGVRAGQALLVLGAANLQLLADMAKLLGPTGSITVVAPDPAALDVIRRAAAAGQIWARQPFHGTHPAFDLRPAAQRQAPVRVRTHLLTHSRLPFVDAEFDAVWIAAAPAGFDLAERDALDRELARVTKPCQPAAVLTRKPVYPDGADPLFCLLIGYRA